MILAFSISTRPGTLILASPSWTFFMLEVYDCFVSVGGGGLIQLSWIIEPAQLPPEASQRGPQGLGLQGV